VKLKGRRFETVSDLRRESQAELDSITESYFHGDLKREGKDDLPVYAPKENILKEMAAKVE
jgi:hypothetical protein